MTKLSKVFIISDRNKLIHKSAKTLHIYRYVTEFPKLQIEEV